MIAVAFPALVEAAGADTGRRRISGVAVPWGVEGRVSSGELVKFHPGALDASARPVALRDHDRTRTIGRVADAGDDGRQMRVDVAVSGTPLGDESLVLAGDGALMFSVGADPTRFDYDERGVLNVYAADWHELSLLPIGAYTGAVVTHVAAAQPEGEQMNTTATDTPDVDDPDVPQLPEDPDAPVEGDDDVDEVETRATPVPITAAAGRRGRPRSPYADYGIRDVARVINASRGGDLEGRRRRDLVLGAQGPANIEAALANVTMVGADNIGAAYRPQYVAELVEIISWGTPMVDVLRQGDLQRGDYPTKAFNSWTKAPTVALQATEKTAINSTAVAITPATCPVNTWAGGNDISMQTVDLGSPSFVEDYIRAAGADYAKKIDTYACTTLLAAATNVATLAGDTFLQVMGKLLGGLSPATTPPGGLFLATSYDVYVGLIGVTYSNGPAFWDGHIVFGQMTPEMSNDAGLTVFCDPNLAARTYIAGHKQGATWYDLPGTPFTLKATDVSLLGLDVAVYGYGALGVQYPGAFAKTVQP